MQSLQTEAGPDVLVMGSGTIAAARPSNSDRPRPIAIGFTISCTRSIKPARGFAASGNTFVEYARL